MPHLYFIVASQLSICHSNMQNLSVKKIFMAKQSPSKVCQVHLGCCSCLLHAGNNTRMDEYICFLPPLNFAMIQECNGGRDLTSITARQSSSLWTEMVYILGRFSHMPKKNLAAITFLSSSQTTDALKADENRKCLVVSIGQATGSYT